MAREEIAFAKTQAAKDLGLAGLSAGLLILSFPRWDLSALAWVGLVPLLIALEEKGLKQAFLLSYLAALLFFTGIYEWIWAVRAFNLLDYALLGAYIGLYGGFFGLGLTWVRRQTGLSAALVAPPLWVTLEYVRAHADFLSSPWMLLGHSQYQHPFLIQITSLTGVYGLSFLIVLVNVAIAEAILKDRRRFIKFPTDPGPKRFPLPVQIVAAFLVIASALYGFFMLSRGIDGDRLTVALVQGNVSLERKWNRLHHQEVLNRYSDFTRTAAQAAPALIVWPETAVMGDLQHNPELLKNLSALAVESHAYMLIGNAESAKFTNRKAGARYYNNMVLLSPEGKIEGQYRKIRLVPFGEYEPLKGLITLPKGIAPAVNDTLAGDQYTVLALGPTKFAVTICWENIFPDLFREFVQRGARFMVNAADESWFGGTAASYQFLAVTVFRAAEHRVAIARATNHGISAFIDPFGRIRERRMNEGLLIGDVPLSERTTFYTRYGDLFAFLLITIFALVVVYAWTCSWLRMPVTATSESNEGKDYAVQCADRTNSSL
jgi:apolipoprotein N-acyltransferase